MTNTTNNTNENTATTVNPIHVRAAKSWANGMGMEFPAIVRQLQNPMLGFGLSKAEAVAVVAVVESAINAEAAATVARRNAEAPIRAEFDAAWKSAARMVTVYDEDGGTSQDLRVPPDWNHDGCRTVKELLRKRGL